ncbi:hypothetical protein [Nocardioides sp. WS12]|uniref:hypothetical protein n=1 Tax=Nocardioides sp. WS12 TaxID=2486272 RepID=UPI0015F9A53F|nr:hypothetical protein [Nocardioides sp. WS12]
MRRLLPVVLALTLVVLSGCGDEDSAPSSEQGAQSDWQRLPDFPLAERDGPLVAWTGAEVLALGGDTGDQCPPNADCGQPNESAVDGAALDPATRKWRRIADAPIPVPSYSPHALVGDLFFVHVDRALLSYDVRADRWETVPRDLEPGNQLVADGDRLVLIRGSDETEVLPDLAYDPATGQWTPLPDDPLGPSYDRVAVSTPHGLLLGAHDLVAQPGGGANPSYLEAALLGPNGKWREFGPSGQVGGWVLSAAGDRVVSLSLMTTNGGGDPPGDYGRQVPGGGRLDVRTGTWSDLPAAPEEGSGGWAVYAPEGRLMANEGYVYDDSAGTWQRIGRPSDAAKQPGPAVWAGDTLVVVTGQANRDSNEANRSNEVWSWSPTP